MTSWLTVAARKSLSTSILFAIVFYTYQVGLKNLFSVLGWASLLPFSIMVLAVMSFAESRYYKHVILFILTVGGLISINHFASYVGSGGYRLDMRFMKYFALYPAGLAYIPFIWLITIPLKKESVTSEARQKIIKGFSLLVGYSLVLSLIPFVPIVATTKDPSLLPFLSVLPLTIHLVILLIALLLLPGGLSKCFVYSSTNVPRLRGKLDFLVWLLLTLFLVSLTFEYYRGMWWFGILSAFFAVLLCINLRIVYGSALSQASGSRSTSAGAFFVLIHNNRYVIAVILWSLTISYFITFAILRK